MALTALLIVAAIAPPPPPVMEDPLFPAYSQVTTAFRCGRNEVSVSLRYASDQTTVATLKWAGVDVAAPELAAVRAVFANYKAIGSVSPQCWKGESRILVEVTSDGRRHYSLISFTKDGHATARDASERNGKVRGKR